MNIEMNEFTISIWMLLMITKKSYLHYFYCLKKLVVGYNVVSFLHNFMECISVLTAYNVF